MKLTLSKCLSWVTKDGIDHFLNFSLTSSANFDIGESYGLVPFASVRSVHYIVRSNHFVQPICSQKPWSAHPFFV